MVLEKVGSHLERNKVVPICPILYQERKFQLNMKPYNYLKKEIMGNFYKA